MYAYTNNVMITPPSMLSNVQFILSSCRTENSLLDDMTNFVQNAFGGSDSRLLPRNEVQ